MKRKYFYGLCLMLTLLLVLAGCGKGEEQAKNDKGSKETQTTLHVAAAASLTDVTKELEQAFKKEHKNVDVTFNYGGSGALRKQIESGANVDVFMSANTKDVKTLEDKDAVKQTYEYAKNQLVLIGEKGTSYKSVTDLKKDDKLALGEVKTVPAGKYAMTYLKDQNVYDKVSSHIVYAKDVRQVLNYVEKGNAQLGFVYETDLYADGKTKDNVSKIMNVELKKPIVYKAGVTSDAKIAESWMTFLKSDEAKAIFKKYHFNV